MKLLDQSRLRNFVLQSLPPGAELIIEISPPIGEGERHYLMAPPSYGTVVVRVIDDAAISVTNPNDKIVFFILAIGPVMQLPPGIFEGISAFLAARKNN